MADGGRPTGAFYPFLPGRDSLRALALRWGLGDYRVDVVLGQAGLAERGGDAVAGNSYGMRQQLGMAGGRSGPFHVVLSGAKTGPCDVLDQAGEHENLAL